MEKSNLQPELPLVKTALVLSAVALAGTVAFIATKEGGSNSDHPPVVRGVHAQVESHRESCGNRVDDGNRVCSPLNADYYIGVEQCQSDIDNARNGKETKSYDPKVGEIYDGCMYGEISVSKETYASYPDGSDIVWPGSPLENVD